MEYQEQDYVRELRQVELSSTLPDIRVTGVQRVRMVVEVDNEPVFDEWLTAGETWRLLSTLAAVWCAVSCWLPAPYWLHHCP